MRCYKCGAREIAATGTYSGAIVLNACVDHAEALIRDVVAADPTATPTDLDDLLDFLRGAS